MTETSLYERLGGAFAIAAVVDHFSDAIVQNPIVGQKSQNPALKEWHNKNLDRLPGLKFMRTLWVCNVAGGPFQYTATKPGSTPVGLEVAHRDLKVSSAQFDEVAAELGRVALRTTGEGWPAVTPSRCSSPAMRTDRHKETQGLFPTFSPRQAKTPPKGGVSR